MAARNASNASRQSYASSPTNHNSTQSIPGRPATSPSRPIPVIHLPYITGRQPPVISLPPITSRLIPPTQCLQLPATVLLPPTSYPLLPITN